MSNENEILVNGKPYCVKCGEPRFVEIDGQFHRCLCGCQAAALEEEEKQERERRAVELFRRNQKLSAIGERYIEARFKTAEIIADNAEQYRVCKLYCDNANAVMERNVGLYLVGENSTGKTYLTACMCNELISRGYTCLYTSLLSILAEIQKSFHNDEGLGQAQVVEMIANKDFVFIDDLGKEFIGGKSAFAEKILLDVINARYNNGKPTIFSSNYSIKELASRFSLDRAIIERIGEMVGKVIELHGHNFRKEKWKEKANFLKSLGI